ncbi:MAG: 3-hydroxyacyl-ACP dehydratase FabZ [Oscillospiraceae bacterium]|jgi:3-hydroxyacyl-[acyl-carrier-protein] dehydratase|nr:3-hydroxyacyl-ACP dehydratase FabZ [Oscillospiraceae bacterium]
MVLLNKEEIMEVIPHREPFLLIDEVTALDPGKKCVAVKHLTSSDAWVPGHFPGYPVTPGVLMVEMLAQAGAVCVGVLPEHKGKTALLAKLDNAKFRRQVLPGETLTLEVEMVKLRAGIGVGRCRAAVGDEVALTCEITFAFQK